ncbi:MAG: S41 family peptidase [Planctomycetota bacterium]|jgi:tricorn protease
MDPGYYTQPCIHGDTIAFVCEDDLWCVDASGGIARRLTAGKGPVAAPVFSPDGERIAFTGSEDGPTEAYVMDATGGPATRRTFLGCMLRTVAWTPDGKDIVVTSNHGRRFLPEFWLHAVPVKGGRTRTLDVGPARQIAYGPDGGRALGINAHDGARWKRYRGGTAGRLWIDRQGDGAFRELIRLRGNLAAPMWIGKRIYFLSDHEGHGNLYSCTPTGRGLKRHTHHEDFYVRWPQSDGKRIVYHAGADLWVYDVTAGKTRRLDIEVRGPRAARARKFVPALRSVDEADLHPAGHTLACCARGGAYTMSAFEGAPLRHGAVSSARHRLPRWLPDGKRFAVVSDEGGEERLEVRRADGSGRVKRVAGDYGRVLDLEVAPKGGDRAVFSNHRTELWLADFKTGRARMVERSGFFRIHGMAWSPDGRYVAYGMQKDLRTSAIHVYDTRTKRVRAVTRPDFVDTDPAFDPDGKYLYFISHRVFDPVYDGQFFELGFPRGSRPYLIPLARTTPSPFDYAARPPRPPTPPEHHEDQKKQKALKVRIDFRGIEDRVVAFPVVEGKYLRVLGTHGRAFFTSVPITGALGAARHDPEPEAPATLEVHDFATDKTEVLHNSMTDFRLSMDHKALLVQAGRELRVLPAAIGPKEIVAKEEYGRETGWVDISRLRIAVEPGAEWRQMFGEAWRLQRDHFWNEDMSKVDWRRVHKRYAPLVERVASRAEFSDLLWEMQGELGTSHCYELGGDYSPPPAWYQGFLGADLRYSRGAWRVLRIPRGDSWGAVSPLAAPGVNVATGDRIVAVDGVAVGKDKSPHECLVNLAGKEVVLTVRGVDDKTRRVAITALPEEYGLRYRDWVEEMRARVHKATKGRVGYIHIPDMGARGFAEFHRYFRTEMDKEGLIIDVRFNGGGHVSDLLLSKLLRRRIGYDQSRWEGTFPYPIEAPVGPMVCLTNEYAGSDGDMFSHAFKLYKLGPLIGKRTWGGVVGIWPRHALVDGTVTTQPEYAFWFEDVEWGVENYGTDPDIEVEITPNDHARGEDPQLERGLAEIRKLMKKAPRPPTLDKRPNLKPPRLG